MVLIDGEVAAPPRLPAGEDRLSALPVDVLINILLKLRDAAAAGQTGRLSRHWRRIWTLLPELCFHPATGPDGIRAAFELHEAPVLSRLAVEVIDATPESLAPWLLIAAPRLSGDLQLINEAGQNQTEDEAAAEAEGGALELPCFQNATGIRLDLGHLALALPPLGVFAGLTDLFLSGVDLRGPCILADAVSSPRCPALQKLTVHHARGRLANLAIHSDSLLQIDLKHLKADDDALGLGNITIHSQSLLQIRLSSLNDMRQLTVFAPALQVLTVTYCYADGSTYNQPVANISAPQLTYLNWNEVYDPSSTQFGDMENLKWLGPFPFLVYGQRPHIQNDWCLGLIRRFQLIQSLRFDLVYPLIYTKKLLTIRDDPFLFLRTNVHQDITNKQYLMEDITRLPDITGLALDIKPREHSFGASVFHVLRMCAGVRKLIFTLITATSDAKAQTACPSGCVCEDQPQNWKTQEFALNCLQQVTIRGLRGTEHEAALIKRLFHWATALEKMTIAFHGSVPERKAKEFSQTLQSFSRLEICSMQGPHFA